MVLEKEDLLFEKTLLVLFSFSRRSGYQLKHVCLSSTITRTGELHKIFRELKESAESLTVLSLVQRDFSLIREARRLARTSLPKLNTLKLMEDEREAPNEIGRMWYLREELGINDLDEGMKYLCCSKLYDIDEEEMSWLSGLKLLEITETCSMRDLKSVLKACKSSLEQLELRDVFGLRHYTSSEESKFGDDGRINMEKLSVLHLPWDEEEAIALSRILETTSPVQRMDGRLHCLRHFHFPSLQELGITTYYDEEDREDVALLTSPTLLVDHEVLLKQNESATRLKLYGWAKPQIDSILNLLLIPSKSNPIAQGSDFPIPGSQLGVEQRNLPAQRSNPGQEVLLPNLVKLTIAELSIEDRVRLDRKLLKKLVEDRKIINQSFEFSLYDEEEDEIPETEREARGWIV